MPKAG